MGNDKLDQLRELVGSKGSLLIAFSGGVDSAVVAKVARNILGERAVAVIIDSETLPRCELEDARRIASEIDIELREIRSSSLSNLVFTSNPVDRCYHCRKEEMGEMRREARSLDIENVADGVNADDYNEHRPGIRAADEANTFHPLAESGITKNDVREIARELGITIWNKPSNACLSSRIPYGERITAEKLERIEKGEAFLRSMDHETSRVRSHGDIARIEVAPEKIAQFLEDGFREKVTKKFKEIGFSYVTLDMEGFRSGSMDEVLER